MTARRFRLRGIVFLPGKTNLRCASLKRCGPPHHGRSTSSRIEIRLFRTQEGQPSRGETAPGNCGCADAYEELPHVHPTTPARGFPRRRAQTGPGCARDPAARARGGTRTHGCFYPAARFHTTSCAGFPCNLGLFEGGRGAVPTLRPGQDVARPRLGTVRVPSVGSLDLPDLARVGSARAVEFVEPRDVRGLVGIG